MDFNDVIGQDSLTRFEDRKNGKKKRKKRRGNPEPCYSDIRLISGIHSFITHIAYEVPEAFYFAALAICTVSCDPNMVYDHFEKTENGEWSWDDVKSFEVDMQDTVNAYNIFIDIRHTKEYPKSNLYVFLSIDIARWRHNTGYG